MGSRRSQVSLWAGAAWAALMLLPAAEAVAETRCDPAQLDLRGPFGQARFHVEIADDSAERAKGLKVGLFRPISLYPFPEQALRDLAYSGKRFLTIEHNMGQMVDDVRLAVRGLADSDFYGVFPGNLPTPDEFVEPIRAAAKGA